MTLTKAVFHLAIFSREQAKSECDWVVMSSVFVASQSSCFFLSLRKQICLVENRLYDCCIQYLFIVSITGEPGGPGGPCVPPSPDFPGEPLKYREIS